MPDKVQRVKGVNDILPEEAKQWQALETIIRSVMERFAYGSDLRYLKKPNCLPGGLGKTPISSPRKCTRFQIWVVHP